MGTLINRDYLQERVIMDHTKNEMTEQKLDKWMSRIKLRIIVI